MKKKYKNKYWEKYKDLYKKAQSVGKYKMFLFDLKNSRAIYANSPYLLDKNLILITNKVTSDIIKLEKKLNKKILHRDLESFDNYDSSKHIDKVVLCKKQRVDKRRAEVFRSDSINPIFYMGDLLQFIINKDSISDEDFYNIFEKNRLEVAPDYSFYSKSAFYETDVFAESNTKLSRTYCVPILEYLAKNPQEMLFEEEEKQITRI